MTPSDSTHKIAENKKAYHDYHIEERMEAGLELKGTEVKSVRQGRVNMGDSYATVRGGELWLIGLHISPYEQGNQFNHEPIRDRRLLMHKREIMRLYGAIRQQGMTLIPTRIYLKRGRVKVEIALARGKRSYDKRESEARKEASRAIERRLKNQRLGR